MSAVDQTADAAFMSLIMDREVRRDPYPSLHSMRSSAPVLQSAIGSFVLTRFDDCHAVLRDPRCGKDWNALVLQTGIANWREHASLALGDHSMLFANPPQHTRLRRLVAKAFTPRIVEGLKPRMAERIDALLVPLAGAGGGDLLDLLAFPLPVAVIGDLLGVPEADRAPFREAVRVSTRILELGVTPEEVDVADRATEWMQDYFRGLIAERRLQARDDMISTMIAAEEGGDRLSEDEMIEMCLLLFSAGFETTTNLIGNGVYHLLKNPDQLALLRKEPDLLPNAIEELLRYDGSILLSGRAAFEDIEVAGHRIPAGSPILTLLGAANRDPARYEDPDRLDLRRPNVEPLSFGSGIHFCLGASLARGEAQLAIGALLTRFQELSLAEEPAFRDQFVFRGLESLRISCEIH